MTVNTLLLVDVQRDFHPGGSLAIPTANEDAERIASLIRTHSTNIHRIVATLDSHHKLHIAHPQFWTNDADECPSPFTIIPAADIESGKWKPRPTVKLPMDQLFDKTIFDKPESVLTEDGTQIDVTKYCLEYARRLEAGGRFQICIWPEHCLIGTEGHAMVPSVRQALDEWSVQTGGSVEFVMKGQNLLTEMYSALAADVPVSPETAFNEKLQASLLQKSDKLLVCGQAMSHCVNYTVRDIVQHGAKQDAAKIVLLTDCASAVPGFEAAAETFQTDMKNAGVVLLESTRVADVLSA
ncbi:Inherit from COG: isochorismatase [Seminavis robusta]|uniref:Inherit from COG: isochorismatase n=1 Tax=Seminavis robusta TaxID=568900 RepID=A0A9N8EYV7_9STRA|nr:Inherit from COG: isochorismatase [Seminavis robusta]|eukprot:Sro2234_g320160.1 Inherit from COG: isochorismatase (296) ;mRNA; r:11547-12434